MNWEQYSSIMERSAIKIDGIATEDSYFMATHMPFSQLEFHEGGRINSTPQILTEDEIFSRIVENPNQLDRMVIVRGDNGTGKSHLIRYLKAKLEMSPATIYNPQTEQLIFLRRLNNSTRGAFSQLLDEHVITDTDTEEKMRKFVQSSEARDEASFMNDILYSYIACVKSDQSGKTYRPVICRDIASFLSDSRVSEYLLREDGAIAKCYSNITAPSNQVLKEALIFTEEDFNVKKILRAVIKQGDPQASDFASSLKDDDEQVNRLVQYLNHFTRDVVQRCAGISSESAKNIFTQLRKDLKKQGKNLTLFIEDFTGFTGIDTELITALSTEHGENSGTYTDLCRVTSVIGITNDYYHQFRDNFTDRVTHQVSVTESSYGTNDFLLQMTARYLNAIYCDPESLRKWNDNGAVLSDLPKGNFVPPCKWETVSIEGKEFTLYPFNSNAIITLYNALPAKSPRMFLRDVLRAQLKEYFDGKIYGDSWFFPLNPTNIQMKRGPHISAIDRMDSFSSDDRNRLKAVCALWGDGSATCAKSSDGSITVGGVPKQFFDDIGLSSFSGVGSISHEDTSTNSTPAPSVPHTQGDSPASTAAVTPARPRTDAATKNYNQRSADINSWFTNGTTLKYDADYRGWLKTLVKGSANQNGAINWQDIGVPAYIAEERLSELASYYIDDQSSATNKDNAIVYMDRSVESRDALLALNEYTYCKGWDFEGSVYYQQRLITWLERRKGQIIENVTAVKDGSPSLPILQWGLATQYLKACILGYDIDTSTPYSAVKSLLQKFKDKATSDRETTEWSDLVHFIKNHGADFDSAYSLLTQSARTTMGAVHYSADSSSTTCYRMDELLQAAEELIAAGWDIEEKLPGTIPTHNLLFNPASLLKSLYPNIKRAMSAETQKSNEILSKIKDYIGELNETCFISAITSINELFAVFSENGIVGNYTQLRGKFEVAPIELSQSILHHIHILENAQSLGAVAQLSAYSKNSSHVLADFLRDLQRIAGLAEGEEDKATKALNKAGGQTCPVELSDAGLRSMNELYTQIEQMEVVQDVTN